ncbi:MAG: hypothetical protein H0U65_17045 [Rubrobacter sp.]|nr:hypothetical protein [Rubrobacter sp.]
MLLAYWRSLIVNDITELVRTRTATEADLEHTKEDFGEYKRESEAEASRSKNQNERLVESNRQLEEANRELTHLNEELQMTNEESLLSTEESQAASEEVETLNEELQATNEELETLNEELQATIEELNTTNDDLHARGMELREYSQAAEEEKSRLYAILDGLPYAVTVVDENGENTFTNTRYKETFGENGFLPFEPSGKPIPDEAHPKKRAARGETFRVEVIAPTIDGEKLHFEIHASPLGEGQPAGGMLSMRSLRSGS